MKSFIALALIFIMAVMAGSVKAADVGGCLDSMGDLVAIKEAGDRIYVKLTKRVPISKYENYYYNAMSLFCICETKRKPKCLKGIKEIIFTNMYGKLGRVFEVGEGGREACYDVSSAPPNREDTMSIAAHTHWK